MKSAEGTIREELPVDREEKTWRRKRRHLRIRKKVFGNAERPRLCVFRSNKHIYAQIIDDTRGETLVAASSLDPALSAEMAKGSDVKAAYQVGKLLGEKALARGVRSVVFDRSGYKYHGRVKALADGAREAGLSF